MFILCIINKKFHLVLFFDLLLNFQNASSLRLRRTFYVTKLYRTS